MSNLDHNPFANQGENPFSDPSVTQATSQSNTNTQRGLENYNPFTNQPQNKQTSDVIPPPTNQPYRSNQPAVMHPNQNMPPPYTPTSGQNVTTSELQLRQEELEKKALELQMKETFRGNNQISRENNWPPLPKKCCVGPCFFQDIAVDIPSEFQKIVRAGYYLWIYHAIVLFINFLGTLAYLIESGKGVTFGMGVLYVISSIPLSFICWFRPLYKAFRSDSSFNFFIFFFIFFFQCCLSIIFAIGIPSVGSCGFYDGLTEVTGSSASGKAVGGILLIIGFLWGVDALASILLLYKVHRIYRKTDASFAKAQAEFTTGVITNEHVQGAATQVATNAATASINQSFGGGGQNRY